MNVLQLVDQFQQINIEKARSDKLHYYISIASLNDTTLDKKLSEENAALREQLETALSRIRSKSSASTTSHQTAAPNSSKILMRLIMICNLYKCKMIINKKKFKILLQRFIK